MIWLVLILIVFGFFGYLVWKGSDEPPPDIDPEAAQKAAIELHRISRRLDVARLKHEQHQAATQARREIAEALNDDAP
jgi:hypothetical protein